MKPPMKLQLKLEQIRWVRASEPNVDGTTVEPPDPFCPKAIQNLAAKEERGRVLHEERTKASRALSSAGPEMSARLQQCPGRRQRANLLTQS